MEHPVPQAKISESFLEHRQVYVEPWLDRWILPNPFVSLLFTALRPVGVELTDIFFNKDASNVGESYLNISIRRLNAAVRIGLDTVTFIAANPNWEQAPRLVQIFDGVSARIREVLQIRPAFQEATLSFHVTQGSTDFKISTAALVNRDLVGDSLFCGISIHRNDGALIIDKSLRYENAAFVRLQRRFAGEASFSTVASRVYEDELAALRLLGLSSVP